MRFSGVKNDPNQRIYLDHNAQTPLFPTVKEALVDLLDIQANPSSVHFLGQKVRGIVEKSRYAIAKRYDLLSQKIIFTSGATEACNFLIKGYRDGPILITSVEHDAVWEAFSYRSEKKATPFTVAPVDHQGMIDLNMMEDWLKSNAVKGRPLIGVIALHNETGVVAPIADLRRVCDRYGARLFGDTSQAIGKGCVDCSLLDAFVISGHKIGAPAGIGAMVFGGDWPSSIEPLIHGGGHRGGAFNTYGAAVLSMAMEACEQVPWDTIDHWRLLLEKRIHEKCPDAIIFGSGTMRGPNTINLTMPGVKNTVQLMQFDLCGIALSAGSACSSGKVSSSRTLKAMGVQEAIAQEAIRVSLGWNTTQEDIDYFIQCWENIYDHAHLS
jgi:cysteine desulfurase